MTLLEGMIGFIAISLLIGIFVLARLAGRIGAAADSVGLAARHVAELAPAARGLIESGQAELTALRSISRTAEGVADDVRAVTSQASAVSSQVLNGFESEVIDRYRAIFAGARAGFDVLRRFRGGSGSVEADEFDHMER
jgi:hypothetical protein